MTPIEPTIVRVSPQFCFHCHGTQDLILDDGPVICLRCIDELVKLAEAESLRAEMERLHRDERRWR